MNSKIAAKTIRYGLTAGLLLCAAAGGRADTFVTFQVDMTEQIALGSFIGDISVVSARGTFNSWGTLALTNDPAGTNPELYTGTADDTADANGGTLSYKYYIDLGDNWESPLSTGGENRTVTLPATSGASLVLPVVYFNDVPTVIPTNNVTFQVDMGEQIILGTFIDGTSTVYCRGSFDDWGLDFPLTNNPAGSNPDLYSGVYAIVAAAGTVEEYKFYIDTGSNWEIPGSTSGNDRSFTLTGGDQTLPVVCFNDLPTAVPTNNVTFQVDMGEQIILGNFIDGTSMVYCRGSFDDWGLDFPLTNNPAGSNPDLYSGVYAIVAAAGTVEQFKFYIDTGSNWEIPGSTSGKDRSFKVTGGDRTLPVVCFNDLPRAVPTNNVTFQVDMGEQIILGNFIDGTSTVYCRGSFENWGLDFPLTNNPAGSNPDLYGGVYAIVAAAGTVEEYKFYIDTGSNWEIPGSTSGNDRSFTLTGGDRTLPVVYFNDLPRAVPTNNVTFQVDMGEQIILGNFIDGTSTVYCRGSFDDWGLDFPLTNNPAGSNPDLYGGVYAIVAAAGTVEQFKFYIDTGSNWEIPGSTSGDDRSFTLSGGDQTLPVVHFNDLPTVVPTNNVTFQVDMSAQIISGTFTPGSSIVYCRGSFENWGLDFLLTNNPAASNTNLYVGTYPIGAAVGTEIQYKFYIDTAGYWEDPISTGGGNRRFTIIGGDQALPIVFFGDLEVNDIAATDTCVTFRVSMTNAVGTDALVFDPAVDAVYMNGNFLGSSPGAWAAWTSAALAPYQLTNEGGSQVYSITLLIPKGSSLALAYKYSIDGADDEAPVGSNHFRYVRTLGNYVMPLDVFGTQYVESSFGNLTIGGRVLYYPTNYPPSNPSDESVAGVTVNLTGATNCNQVTATDGSYSLAGIGCASGYCVGLAKSDDDPPANGVTTLDIALIRRHILGLVLLDSPYKLLAADVNGSKTITTVDIALIRRLILGLTNTYPMGLWRFVPADYVFADPTSPWDAPANRWYTNLVADASGQDFVAIKLGDVNNSWIDPGVGPQVRPGKGSEPAARANLRVSAVRLAAGRQAAEPGQRVGVRVSVGGLGTLSTAQFTLGWDAKVLRYAGVGEFGLRGLGDGNFGAVLADSGRLTFSWDDPQGTGVEAADGTTMFAVYFDVIGAAGSVSPLAFQDSPTAREVSVAFAQWALASEDGQVVVRGARPVISWSEDRAKGTFRISVPSVTGRRYILESAERLSSTEWRALAEVEGDGSVKSLTDPTVTAQQRFYRVRVE